MCSIKLCALAIAVAGCGSTSVYYGSDGGDHGQGDGSIRPPGDQGVTVCSPQDPPSCDGAAVATCRSDGSGYDYALCSGGCASGACTCKTGDVMCLGQDVRTCGMDGAFHTTRTCMVGSKCENGTCAEARCSDETMSTNPHALPTNAWPRYRHDNRNSGSTQTPLALMPKMKWKVPVGGTNLNSGGMGSGPVVNQANLIFVTGGDLDPAKAGLHNLNGAGNELWFFPAMTGFASSTPAVRADGTSYFSIQVGGMLFAVDPMGKQAWQYQTQAQADSDPIVTKDGTLVYSSDDGSVYALSAGGKLLWQSNPQTGPGEVDAGIAETCDGKIVLGGRNGWFELDAATGKTLWSVPTTGVTQTILSSPLVTADGTVYGFDSGGMGYAIAPTGKPIWSLPIGPNVGFGGASTGKIGNTIFSVLNDGSLYAVDAGNGKVLWSRPVGTASREINAGPISDGNLRLYVNGNDGFVYCFDVAGNQQWRIPSSGVANANMDLTGTPAIGNDGMLYVPGNDGYLYAFQ